MPIRITRASLTAALALLLAATFITIPAWQSVSPGPFEWHVHQPAFVQGGIEALALIALVGGAFALRPSRIALLFAGVALALFLRRHAVDIPLLIDLLYLEIVVGLGMLVRRCCGRRDAVDASAYLQAFVLGFIAWSLVAWTASAFGAGSIRQLRAMTLALGIAAIFARTPPLLVFLWRSLRVQKRGALFACGALAAWMAVLYARTNVVLGYDALWYGLRTEYVLVPGHSVFDALGLVSPVHYFPKLHEMFLLPVSALGDSSAVSGLSIWVLVLTLLACSRIAAAIGLDPRVRLPLLAAIATLPALAAVALHPKPDAMSVLFALVAVDGALAFARTRQRAALYWTAAAAVLACLAKLTAIPFMGVLVLGCLWHAWRTRTRAPLPDTTISAAIAAFALLGALVLAIFVTARTYLLAGMPTIGPDPLFRLWRALGMTLRDPVGTLQWTWPQNWAGVPALLLDGVFRPWTMPHIVITWLGNLWLWFVVLAAAAGRVGRRVAGSERPVWPLAIMAATAFVLATAIGYRERGGDGNYFLAGLVPGILLAAHVAFARNTDTVRKAMLACLPAFALFQATYSFVSAGWAPGTRAFDLALTRNWHDSRRQRWDILRNAGLERIGVHLKEAAAGTRIVGCVDEPADFWLPTRFEGLLVISYSRPEFVDTEAGFERFLRDQRIDGLILPKTTAVKNLATRTTPAVMAVATRLERAPGVVRVDDRDYYLLDLSARRRD